MGLIVNYLQVCKGVFDYRELRLLKLILAIGWINNEGHCKPTNIYVI